MDDLERQRQKRRERAPELDDDAALDAAVEAVRESLEEDTGKAEPTSETPGKVLPFPLRRT